MSGMADEEARPRMPALAKAPSLQEQEEHAATGHACYRSWCIHCVYGKGQGGPQIRTGPEAVEIPEVGVDFCYLGGVGDASDLLPIVALRERPQLTFRSGGLGLETIFRPALIRERLDQPPDTRFVLVACCHEG